MARGDNRQTPKMKRRKAQAKLKARRKRRIAESKAQTALSPPSRPAPPRTIRSSPMAATVEANVAQAAPRYVTSPDLIAAVAATTDLGRPIAWSPDVRVEFARLEILTGERTQDPAATWNGRQFETADHTACRDGQIQKWKSITTIGWSLSGGRDPAAYARALESAAANGYRRLDYVGRRWQPRRYDAVTGTWIAD